MHANAFAPDHSLFYVRLCALFSEEVMVTQKPGPHHTHRTGDRRQKQRKELVMQQKTFNTMEECAVDLYQQQQYEVEGLERRQDGSMGPAITMAPAMDKHSTSHYDMLMKIIQVQQFVNSSTLLMH